MNKLTQINTILLINLFLSPISLATNIQFLANSSLTVSETDSITDSVTKTDSGIANTQLNTSKANIKRIGLDLEYLVETQRDRDNIIKGQNTLLTAEPNLKISSKISIASGASYIIRELGGTEKSSISKNKDHLDSIFFKALYNPTKFNTNGIADIRLNFRAYQDQDSFFKQRYGSDGNYQFRAYFGRPLTSRISINKYTTYLRYKKYSPNSYSSQRSRDYELRARITPTYKITNALEVSSQLTYNHIFKRSQTLDEETIEASLSTRYNYKKYALTLAADALMMSNLEGESVLKTVDDIEETIAFSLLLNAYL